MLELEHVAFFASAAFDWVLGDYILVPFASWFVAYPP
jgi:hypothetical protein